MATDLKPNWKKIRSYWKQAFFKTWKETEVMSIVWEAIMGGLGPSLLAVALKVAGRDEAIELIFLAIAGALCSTIIPFVCRLLFVTPEKILREAEKRSENSGLPTQAQNIAEAITNRQISGLIILSCICISLALVLALQISKNSRLQSQMDEPKKTKQEATAKALPDKIIPNPHPAEPSAPAAPEVAVNASPQKSFETNDLNSSTLGNLDDSVLARAEEAIKKKEKEEQQAEVDRHATAQKEWDLHFPSRNYCLESLADMLKKEAIRAGDGIFRTEGYLQCLPKIVNLDENETVLAEIGFRTKTNVSFRISVFNPTDHSKALRISCSEGNMELYTSGGNLKEPYCAVHVPRLKYDNNVSIPLEKSHETIDEGLSLLLGCQIKYASTKQ